MEEYLTKARTVVAFADTFSDAVYSLNPDHTLIEERAEQLAEALRDLAGEL